MRILASATVLFTILFSLAFGIACGYAVITAILHALARRPEPAHRAPAAPAVAASAPSH